MRIRDSGETLIARYNMRMTKKVVLGTDIEAKRREGLSGNIEPWEDGLRASTGKGTFEWWYFDAHFDDGSTAVIVFMTKPLLDRKGPLKPSVSITITPPGGEKHVHFPIYSPQEFSASQEYCNVKIANSWVKYLPSDGGGWRYQLHAEGGNLGADLVFDGLVPPWRPGAGKSYFGDYDHYFAWLPSIPYGSVRGTLTVNGKTSKVEGTGYHDHNWGNVSLNNVIDHWLWARAHVEDYTLIFVDQVTVKSYGSVKLPVFMLMKGGKLLTGDGKPLRMEASEYIQHEEGHTYPSMVDFFWQKGDDKIHIALRNPQLIEAVTLLGTFPKWQQKFIRLFSNPYYFRFNAQIELTVDFSEIHEQVSGPMLYEIMLLK